MPIVDFSLKEKVALINGGSRGIGEAIARAFSEQGATVVLSSRKQEGLDAVADSINTSGGKAVPIVCHAVVIRTADEQHIRPRRPEIAHVNIRRQVGPGDVPDMQPTV